MRSERKIKEEKKKEERRQKLMKVDEKKKTKEIPTIRLDWKKRE